MGHALGLGKLSVSSALDEPLEAEIGLTAVALEELGSVEAGLGSPSDFERAGVQLLPSLQELEFEATTNQDGDPYIRITSEAPLTEPFLHFVVAVEWAGGKLLREYTALLDPPLYAQGNAGVISGPRLPGGGVETRSEPETAAAAESWPLATSLPLPPLSDASAAQAPPTTGVALEAPPIGDNTSVALAPTRRGDTLWGIASKIGAPAGTSIYQMMLAIQQANPHAFIDGNLNRLKTGQILRVPDAAEVKALTGQGAVREYQAQLADWEAYRLRTAVTTQMAKVGAELETTEPTTPGAAMVETPAPASAASRAEAPPAKRAEPEAEALPATMASEVATASQEEQDLLRIVRATMATTDAETVAGDEGLGAGADVASASQAEVRALQAEVATLEEALVSRDLEVRDLRDKVRLLEEQVQKATRLLEIESENLALAQQAAMARVAETATAGDQSSSTPQAQGRVAGDPQEAQSLTAAEAVPTPQQPRSRIEQLHVAAIDTLRGWWERWRDTVVWNWQIIVLGVLGLAAVLAGALMFKRRRSAMAEFEQSMLSAGELENRAASTATSGTIDDSPGKSFLSDFGAPGMGAMQEDEVDPLAEAEVYIAYGRDEQAEEVLKEAIGRDASRPELKLKLLEVYHKRNDVGAFEALAEELHATEGEQPSDTWSRVVEMGRKVNPDNPLFKIAPALVAGAATAMAAATDDGGGENADLMQGGNVNPRLEPFPEPGSEESADAEKRMQDSAVQADGLDFDELADDALEPFPEPDREQFPDVGEIERRISGEVDVAIGATRDESFAALEEDAASDEPGTAHAAEGTEFGAVEFDLDNDTLDALVREEEADALIVDDEENDVQQDVTTASGDDLFGLDPTSEDEGIDESEAQALAQGDAEVEPIVDVSPLELTDEDLKDPEDEGEEGASENLQYSPWDESATKLDLAKAYLDMGDQSGARNIIDEVLREGNEGQRKQAAELATQLAS